MAMADQIVDVQIDIQSDTLSRESYGTLMIAEYHTAYLDRVRAYTDADGVAVDFANAAHPARIALEAALAQNPRPQVIKLGRRALPPTRTRTLAPQVTTEGFVYQFSVEVYGGATVATTAISYTVLAAATTTTIATALASTINAITGVAATSSTGTITANGEAAGTEWAIVRADRIQVEALRINDTTTDPGIATDLTAIRAADASWYGLAIASEGKAESVAAAAWVETNGSNGQILYAPATADYDVSANVASNVAITLNGLTYKRTLRPFYVANHTRSLAGIRMLAMALPYEPGEIQWTYKTLAGLLPDNHSATVLGVVETLGVPIYYEILTGTPRIAGKWAVKDCYGEWADVRIGVDWLRSEMRSDLLAQLLNSPKVPFTQTGIDQLESIMKGTLERGTKHVITPGYATQAPKVSTISAADKAARRLSGLKFQGTLQGAITSSVIRGTVMV